MLFIFDLLCLILLYAHEKTCASFCSKLWLDYYITKVFIKTVLNLSYYASIMFNAFGDLLCRVAIMLKIMLA